MTINADSVTRHVFRLYLIKPSHYDDNGWRFVRDGESGVLEEEDGPLVVAQVLFRGRRRRKKELLNLTPVGQ